MHNTTDSTPEIQQGTPAMPTPGIRYMEWQEATIPAANLPAYVGWSAQGITTTERPLWGKIEAVTPHPTYVNRVVVRVAGNGHAVRVENPITGTPHMVTVGRSVEIDAQPEIEDNDAEVEASVIAHDLALPADDGSVSEGTPTTAVPELHALANIGSNAVTIDFGTLTLWYSYSTLLAYRTPAEGVVISENLWGATTGKHLNAVPGAHDAKNRLPRAEFEARAARLAFAIHNAQVTA